MVKKAFCLSGVLVLASVAMPWFTFDAQIMGYYWGAGTIPWTLIPAGYIVFYARHGSLGAGSDILWELSLLSFPATYLYTFFTWPIQSNITGEINVSTSMCTATPFFWFSLLSACVFAAAGSLYPMKNKIECVS